MILDLIFPRYNEDFSDISTYLSTSYIQDLRPWKKKLSASSYSIVEGIWVFSSLGDPYIKELVYRFKLGEYSIATSLSSMISYHINNDTVGFVPPADIITFVPPDPKRLLERGFHPPERIAQFLGKLHTIPSKNLLIKTTSTPQQAQLSRKERLKSLKNVFAIDTSSAYALRLHNYEIVWLIDDIVTTGTTMLETAKVIKKQFPFLKIYCLAVSSN